NFAGTRVRESGWSRALALSLLALAYTLAVIVVAWRAPTKGFVSFTGRRVIAVESGSEAARAGVRRGDIVEAVAGRPLGSTLDYAYDLMRRRPGETVVLDFARPYSGTRLRAVITLLRSPPPLPAITASILAAALLALGLIARWGRPGDLAA